MVSFILLAELGEEGEEGGVSYELLEMSRRLESYRMVIDGLLPWVPVFVRRRVRKFLDGGQ